MNITDPNFRYTPAVATDIRKTFAKVNEEVEWRCRIEGALEVMRKIQAEDTKVTRLDTYRRKT